MSVGTALVSGAYKSAGKDGRGQPSQAARLRSANNGARSVARILLLSLAVTRGASSAHVTA
jgi:hypothetical protein